MRARPLHAIVLICCLSCGGAASETRAPSSAAPAANATSSEASSGAPPAPQAPKSAGSELTDNTPVAFRADFSGAKVVHPWNVFGAQSGNREVKGGADGLSIRIADAERAWDAVGARTAKLKVDGDFDLRGRFRDFSTHGNGSTKLIVVDASNPRGEAAYVERIQIDGKNLFKFGGEVDGSLETWGFVPTDAAGGDLRIERAGNMLHAYARPNERSPWSEIGKGQATPKSMPRIVKFGVKLSAEAHKSAQVRWVELTLNGQVIRME